MSDSYRVTSDVSHKVKGGGGHAAGFLHHIARDLDGSQYGQLMADWSARRDAALAAQEPFTERPPKQREHSNKNIDPTRTHMNETVIPDGSGGWRRPSSVDEVLGRLDERLARVKKPPRDGAVIMRGHVANLSPEWFAENNPDWRENGLNDEARAAYDAMLQQAYDEYGDDLLVGCLHMDETTPQWQFAVVPVTDDGRLTQKLFWASPKVLKEQGERFREAVAATGIAVNMKPSARSQEHLSGDEFARRADDLREREQEVEEWAATLETAAATIDARKANVAAREAKTKEDAQEAASDRQRAAEARARAEQAEKAAEAERARLADVLTWMDTPQSSGATARANFDGWRRRKAKQAQFEAKANALAEQERQHAEDGPQLGGGSSRPAPSLFDGQRSSSSPRPSSPSLPTANSRSMAAKVPPKE